MRLPFRVRRVSPPPSVQIGDAFTINIDQIDRYFIDPYSRTINVVVHDIKTLDDGKKEIILRTSPKQDLTK